MNYDRIAPLLQSPTWLGRRPGPGRMAELLRRLGDPHKSLRFAHIAGTNGKGSTAVMLAAVLRAAGHRTGLYSSPFIGQFNERIQVNGTVIDDDELLALAREVAAVCDSMDDPPAEFERITAIAMCCFARQRCGIVVLEVGLGGRLDPTNVIDCPEVAVITAIGYDHTEYLGDTLEKIAAEKAGIIKPGGEVVLYAQQQSVEEVVEQVCRLRGARLRKSRPATPIDHDLTGQRFDCPPYRGLTLSLLGRHQLRNAAVVLGAAEVLRGRGFAIGEEALRRGLATARWPGRFELLGRQPDFLVDGGHNLQGVETLRAGLEEYFPQKPVTLLAGMLADKDCTAMLALMAPRARRLIAVTPPTPRALPAAELAALAGQLGIAEVHAVDDVAEGVALAQSLTDPDGMVCAFGSLYMVGTIRACLGAKD